MQNIITKKFIQNVAITSIVSIVVNVILLFIVRPMASAPETFSPFHYSSVILFTLFGVLGAALVYIGIKKFFPIIYKKLFVWVSVITLILSFIPDILMPYSTEADDQGATLFIVIILMIMHVLTAGIVVYMFTKKSD
jgi:hypothetical protein